MINEEEWQSQVTSLARHLSSDSQIYPAVAACSPRTSSHLSFPDRSSWKKKDFSYLICNLPSLSRLTCLLTFQHTKKITLSHAIKHVLFNVLTFGALASTSPCVSVVNSPPEEHRLHPVIKNKTLPSSNAFTIGSTCGQTTLLLGSLMWTWQNLSLLKNLFAESWQ